MVTYRRSRGPVLTRIKPPWDSSEKRSPCIYSFGQNLLHAISELPSCSFMLSLKVLHMFWVVLYILRTKRSDHVKTVENYKTITPKGGCSRLQEVPTTGLNWKIWCFGSVFAYGRWSLVRVGHTWRFDCTSMTKFLTSSRKQLLARQSWFLVLLSPPFITKSYSKLLIMLTVKENFNVVVLK